MNDEPDQKGALKMLNEVSNKQQHPTESMTMLFKTAFECYYKMEVEKPIGIEFRGDYFGTPFVGEVGGIQQTLEMVSF